MGTLLEYVGTIHIFLGPYRGNPIALYLQREGERCVISPKVYPWKEVVGEGETPNKAAANFEEKWKAKGLPAEMYNGPSWEGGIKPERPKPPPPKPPADVKAASPTPQGGAQPSSSTPPGGNQAKPEGSTTTVTPPVSGESGSPPTPPSPSTNSPSPEQGSPTIQTHSPQTDQP